MTAPSDRLLDTSIPVNPYRLDVLTPNLAAVIAEAGGWIVDRALAGWSITVIESSPTNSALQRAGKVIGAEIASWDSLADTTRSCPYGIAVAAELYQKDSSVCDYIGAARANHSIEISVVGVGSGALADDALQPITHRVSGAGLAFKRYSLAAAGLPSVGLPAVEQFHSALLPRAGVRRRAGGSSNRLELGPGQVNGLPSRTSTESRKLFALPHLQTGQ